MNNPAKGGRGKRAPYNTSMCRIPEPIKHLAEELSTKYRELVTDFENPEDPALIAAVLKAIAPGGNRDTHPVEHSLHLKSQLKTLNGWSVGDKCSVQMPSGVTITEAEIASIQSNGNCKISVPSTHSHFPSNLESLIKQ